MKKENLLFFCWPSAVLNMMYIYKYPTHLHTPSSHYVSRNFHIKHSCSPDWINTLHVIKNLF